MTLRDAVKKLREEGFKISYKVRTDGGIVITYIDGRKFSERDREGNKIARLIAGGNISEKQARQRETASTKAAAKRLKEREALAKAGRNRPKRPSKVDVPRHIRSLITQANKALSKTKNKYRISIKKIKQAYRRGESWRQIGATLTEAIRHAKGKPYEAEIDWVIGYLRGISMGHLADKIEKKRNSLTEKQVAKIREAAYRKRSKREMEEIINDILFGNDDEGL